MLKYLALAFALAYAQSPNEQAMGAKILREVNEGLQCQAALISAQAKIKELEEKLNAK